MKALNLVLTLLFHSLRALGRARSELVLENLALRQQVTLLQETVGSATLATGSARPLACTPALMAPLAGRSRPGQA